MKRFGARLLAAIVAGSLIVTPVMAAPSIDELKEDKAEKQSEVNSLQEELKQILSKINGLEEDLVKKGEEIIQATDDLAAAEVREREQYEAMKLRIQYMYENGNQNFITALIESKDITELLNRVEYVSEVYDYDRELLTAYQNTVQQVEDLSVQLQNEMAQMEELHLSYEEQETSLNQIIADKSARISDFDRELSSARSLAGQYASTIRQQNQVIAAEEERIRREEAARKAREEEEKKKKEEKEEEE